MFRSCVNALRMSVLAVFISMLSACGGGGGSGGSSNDNSGSGGSLTLSPTALFFTAQQNGTPPSSNLSAWQTITAIFTESSVAALIVGYPLDIPTPTWLSVSTTGATNASPINISVAPNTTALSPGIYTTTLRFVTVKADQTIISIRDATVTYTVTAIPTPQLQGSYISPRIGTTNVAGTVVLRGNGLSAVTSLSFGGVPATSFTVMSGTEIHANYPALAAGTYAVRLNGGAISFPAQMVIVDAPTFAATSIPYPNADARVVRALIYDAERKALIVGVNDLTIPSSSGLLRYAYTTSWQTPTSTSIDPFRDAALSMDGTSLLTLSNSSLITVNAATLAQGAAVNNSSVSLSGFKNIAMANDGNAIVTTGENVIGYTDLYVYGTGISSFVLIPTGTFTSYIGLYHGTPAASADGSRVVLIQGDSSLITTPPVNQYLATSSSLVGTSLSLNQSTGVVSPLVAPAIDRAGTRMVLTGTKVYDNNYTLLGTLPSTTLSVVLKPDATRAYTYDSSGRVRTFDLTGTPNGGAYTEVGTGTTLAANPGAGVKMAITPDGGALFLAGGDSIVVLPAP